LLALRKAEKEEERRAREKIKQKLEEDKVLFLIVLFFLTSEYVSHLSQYIRSRIPDN
jgi:hypothetical protein